MILFFQIHYLPQPGEHLYFCANIPSLGNSLDAQSQPMQSESNGLWTLTMEVESLPTPLTYHYLVQLGAQTVRKEFLPHTWHHLPDKGTLRFFDQWNESDFSEVFQLHKPQSCGKGHLVFRSLAHCVPSDAHLALVGSSTETGEWDPARALILHPQGSGNWELRTDQLALKEAPLEYKLVVLDNTRKNVLLWEEGDNRFLDLSLAPISDKQGTWTFISSGSFRTHNAHLRYAGVAIPIFSLRSKNSWGIGDFSDLRKMADWAMVTGMRMLQILPVNDTTMFHNWIDSYPYGGISIMALHPIYIDPRDCCSKDVDLSEFEKERKTLNALPSIDYAKVLAFKGKVMKAIFRKTHRQVFQSEEYKTFFEENKSWLRPYALFCCLRDRYKTADFTQWGAHAVFDSSFLDDEVKGMDLHYFIQFHLDCQLCKAHRYMQSKGIALKGDIPIGITPRSVEAWTQSHLFKMDSQAGAPPDAFSADGQNWGFPTYNWEQMEKDGYSWWRSRFVHMARHFDAYRIDHILGFFRIWSIPANQKSGLMGHFDPAKPFSVSEIHAAGLPLPIRRLTEPYITQDLLEALFPKQTDYVKEHFLKEEAPDGYFQLQEAFASQKSIQAYFEALPKERQDESLKKGLFQLVAQVLFVPDPQRPDTFHPRIIAQNSHTYRALPQSMKEAFHNLSDNYFYYRHNDFWKEQALKKLPALISATSMLCCAEDLGMIPACVPDVMAELKILSLEIQRMSKDPSQELGNPAYYPFLSVCTTSTHDTSTLRGWWLENPDHNEDASPQQCEQIVKAHLDSPSMLCLLPWQDWMSLSEGLRREDPCQERINVPANEHHYWRYRMHLNLEDLLKEKEFALYLKGLITASGRSH